MQGDPNYFGLLYEKELYVKVVRNLTLFLLIPISFHESVIFWYSMNWNGSYDFMSHLNLKLTHDVIIMASKLKISNLHIMTSAYLRKIDCFSVNIDWLSSKFWYVLAETILYK